MARGMPRDRVANMRTAAGVNVRLDDGAGPAMTSASSTVGASLQPLRRREAVLDVRPDLTRR